MIWSFEIVSFRSSTTDQGLSLFRECQKVVALGKLKKVVSVQTINTTGEFMEKPRNVDTLLYREVSTFLDIRQFEGFPSKNVETSLYSKVSTFLGFSMNCRISKKMWKPPYIVKYPHFWAFQ